MKVQVFDAKGKESGEKDLDSNFFEAEISDDLLKQAVVRYQANLRSAIAKTKTRGERRGGGRKPWRQKGTGRARAGTRRSPIWRKGGIVFGPTGEENYHKDMPRKAIKLSISMALSRKAKENRILIINDIKLEKPQTKKVEEIFKNLPVTGKVLFIFDNDPILYKSAINLPYIYPNLYNQMNTYSVLVADYIVIAKSVSDKVVALYGQKKKSDKKDIKTTDKESPKKVISSKTLDNTENATKEIKEKAGKKVAESKAEIKEKKTPLVPKVEEKVKKEEK